MKSANQNRWSKLTKLRQIYRFTEQMAAIDLGDGEVKKIMKRDYDAQTSSCKVNESWLLNVQCGENNH